MTKKTLAENVETATKVIKEVKETIISKGVEIPEGTHATEYPGYIEKMRSETDFSELEKRVTNNENNIKSIKNTTVWGQPLTSNITGGMLDVANIEFGIHNYRIGSATVRPNIIYLNQGICVGTVTGVDTADESGFYAGRNGTLALMTSTEDHQTSYHIHPKILFYLNNSGTVTSSIREAYPGVLSMTNKVYIGGIRRTEMNNTFSVSGGTSQFGDHIYSNGNIFSGINKYGSYDGVAGVSMTTTGNVHITSNENPSIRFYRSNATEATSSLIEGVENCLSVKENLNIGSIQLTKSDHTLNVNGSANITGSLTAETVNGIPLTASGNGSQFLADDGKYHAIELNNYLPLSGGTIIGDIKVLDEASLKFTRLGSYRIYYNSSEKLGLTLESGNSNFGITLDTRANNKDVNINTGSAKLQYNNVEVATINDLSEITTLQNKVTELEQLIQTLTEKLSE